MKSEINIKVTPTQFRWAVEDALTRVGWKKTGASYGMGHADLWYLLPGPAAEEFMPDKIEVNLPELN